MKARRMYFRRGPADCPLVVYRIHSAAGKKTFRINHWHPQIEINYLKQGKVLVKRLTSELLLQEGQFCLMPPDEIHEHVPVGENNLMYTINFSTELITLPDGHFFQKNFLSPLRSGKLQLPEVITSSDGCYNEALSHLMRIIEADKGDPAYKSIVFLHTLGFCLAILPICNVTEDPQLPTGSKGNEAIKRCHKYIGENYMKPITLEQLSEHVHLHPNYLCRLFKKHTGQTVVENINAIRVSFATQFIRNSNKTLPQIADACGFNSMTYFTKVFKQHTGSTPYAYSKLFKNL